MNSVRRLPLLILLTLLLILSCGARQDRAARSSDEVNWLTWSELDAAHAREPRKVLVDLYTDWCGWCKVMDRKTYAHPAIIDYINTHYHAVKFDAESRSDIVMAGDTFSFVDQGSRGYHELAAALMGGRMSYPTTVVLSEEMENLGPIPGYLEVDVMETVLVFFAEDHHETTPWEDFERGYTPGFSAGEDTAAVAP